MRKVEYEILTFEELLEESKQVAIQEKRDEGTWEEWDSSDLEEMWQEELTSYGWKNPKIRFSLSYCQGDGVSFLGKLPLEVALKIDYITSRLDFKVIYKLRKLIDHGIEFSLESCNNRCVHEKSVKVYVNWGDLSHKSCTRLEKLVEKMRELVDDWRLHLCKTFEKEGYEEIEYHDSDEWIKEELISVDAEFYPNGKRYRGI